MPAHIISSGPAGDLNLSSGTVSNNSVSSNTQYGTEDQTGLVVWNQQELIIIDIARANVGFGSPLLDCWGRIIGAISSQDVNAVAERFLRPVIEDFLDAVRCPSDTELELIPDALGDYYRFTRGYFGVAWEPVFPFSFDSVWGPDGNTNIVLEDGKLVNYPTIKEMVGIKIV